MGIRYATREQIKAAAKINGADFNATIDRLNEDASRAVERLTRRKFYPTTAIKYYDYPAKDSKTFGKVNTITWRGDDGEMRVRLEPLPEMPPELKDIIRAEAGGNLPEELR